MGPQARTIWDSLELLMPAILRITLLRSSKMTYDAWDLGASGLGLILGFVGAKLIISR